MVALDALVDFAVPPLWEDNHETPFIQTASRCRPCVTTRQNLSSALSHHLSTSRGMSIRTQGDNWQISYSPHSPTLSFEIILTESTTFFAFTLKTLIYD